MAQSATQPTTQPTTQAIALPRFQIVRVLIALITAELRESRKSAWSGLPTPATEATRISEHSQQRLLRRQAEQQVQQQDSLPHVDNERVESSTEASFEADSLELLALAGRVNQFFHLHETGVEDYLLRRHTVGEWADIVQTALTSASTTDIATTGIATSGVTFRTSGSTGEAKVCTHSWTSLWQEAEELARVLRLAQEHPRAAPIVHRPCRIIACVEPHHIYGFLFTVLLPSLLCLPEELVVTGLQRSPSLLFASEVSSDATDILVSHPAYWHYLASSGIQFPPNLCGITSTAPCPPELKAMLHRQGVERLVEVYGSSETAGIGYRESWRGENNNAVEASTEAASGLEKISAMPFRLFSYWRFGTMTTHSNNIVTATTLKRRTSVASVASVASEGIENKVENEIENEIEVEAPDIVECVTDYADGAGGERAFMPRGRHDGAVQVGGVNVFPAQIAARIQALDDVQECAVRLMRSEEGSRLKAFIVLASGADEHAFRERFALWLQQHCSAPERPKLLTFGAALPRNAMGKLTDW
jgi:long-chain acyl-CoA synthetase